MKSILDGEILKIQLLTLWDATRSSSDIENKYGAHNKYTYTSEFSSNLRFAAYRSMYFWLYGKRKPSSKYRTALPAGLISIIKEKKWTGNLGLSGVDKVVDYVTNDYIRSASSTRTNVRGTSASQKTMAKIWDLRWLMWEGQNQLM